MKDEQMFILQVSNSIFDFPCSWFGYGTFFWNAANLIFSSFKTSRFLEIHCEAVIISYAQIEFQRPLITARPFLTQPSLQFTN